ncbi:MAG: WecB/TagA/CpsF family glycosyltransferase [Patescibacteria group bacterium]|nr:WecB/TagA/CpsF family glycosyltransferase [Patescibacteria group bacterium]
MDNINIAGLNISKTTKAELLAQLAARIKRGQQTFVTTPYSEFLYRCLKDSSLLEILNRSDFAVADGIGLFWAARFLSIPLAAKSYSGKILQSVWQAKYSLLSILFYPKFVRSSLPEKIPGSDLIWDLAELAAKNNWSIYLLGGFNDTPELAAGKLAGKFAGKLRVAGWSNKNPGDATVIKDIKNANPDILLVAYGPVKQERWIAENLQNLPAKLAIGLGGSFDYLAGKKTQPPKIIRRAGLEWLFRLATQPRRIKRIFQATFGLTWALIKYRVFSSLPFRQNVASVILNQNGLIFIAKFNPGKAVLRALGYSQGSFQDYWQLPQGGLEKNEGIEQGAKREIQGETAITSIKFMGKSGHIYSYLWKDMGKRPLFVAKRYHYKGQEQHIAYFKFFGQDMEIKLDRDEFVEYKWVPWQNLEKEVHREKQDLAKIILEDLIKMREKAII